LPQEEQNLSVSQILAKFSDYKINMELALQAYTSSQVSLEKSRIEAYRQLKYLVTVESPTNPQDAKYPEVLYNISLFLVVTLMIFGIGRIIIATVTELR
jgi:capsular polysaccharide transport system permease protein